MIDYTPISYFLKKVRRIIESTFIIREFFPVQNDNYLFLHPISLKVKEYSVEPDLDVVFKSLDGAQTYNVPFSDVIAKRVKLSAGIYPIISIRQKVNLLQHMRNRDEILVNMALTVVADPSQKINFYTDTNLNIPIAGMEQIFFKEPYNLPFLVVDKDNTWEIKVFDTREAENELFIYKVPITGLSFNKFVPPEGKTIYNYYLPFGSKPIYNYYFMNELVFEAISNLLWDKNKEPSRILIEIANKLWTYEMLKATAILFYTATEMEKPELFDKINLLADDINKNPNYHPFPSSKNYIWVNYEDIISGKYKLQPKIYTITQYHYRKMFIEPPNDKIKPERSIVLDNSIVIYNMPITLIDKFEVEPTFRDGIWKVDLGIRLWRINFLFPWPEGYMVIFSKYVLFNPYLEVSTTLGRVIYIPEELSQFLSDTFNSIEKNKEEIENETKYLMEKTYEWLNWELKEDEIWKEKEKEIAKLKQERAYIQIVGQPLITLPKEEKQELKKQLEQSVMKGVITIFCWWPKYTQDTYLIPKIYAEGGFSHSFGRGHVHIFPKPTFLPNQIHVRKPEDIKNIPEGVYPVIRYHSYGDKQIVFAISPDTEVIFHDSRILEEIKGNIYAKPIEMYGLDLIVIWKGLIERFNIVEFNRKKWDNPRHRPTYWEGVYNGLSMFYLPEVIFKHLMGEKIEPKQEPFVSEIITNIKDKTMKEFHNWLDPIVEKYTNIPIGDDVEILGFLDFHKMPGVWYVQKLERKIDGDYKNNEIVIVNMRDTDKVFRVRIPWQILKIAVFEKLIFITVWPDGTMGWWDLAPF
jgi:hypothetical protein